MRLLIALLTSTLALVLSAAPANAEAWSGTWTVGDTLYRSSTTGELTLSGTYTCVGAKSFYPEWTVVQTRSDGTTFRGTGTNGIEAMCDGQPHEFHGTVSDYPFEVGSVTLTRGYAEFCDVGGAGPCVFGTATNVNQSLAVVEGVDAYYGTRTKFTHYAVDTTPAVDAAGSVTVGGEYRCTPGSAGSRAYLGAVGVVQADPYRTTAWNQVALTCDDSVHTWSTILSQDIGTTPIVAGPARLYVYYEACRRGTVGESCTETQQVTEVTLRATASTQPAPVSVASTASRTKQGFQLTGEVNCGSADTISLRGTATRNKKSADFSLTLECGPGLRTWAVPVALRGANGKVTLAWEFTACTNGECRTTQRSDTITVR